MNFALALVLAASARAAEIKTVVNCVDGSLTIDPGRYVSQQVEEWKNSDEFAGVVAGDPEPAQEIAETFFTKGFFVGGFPTIVYQPKLEQVFQTRNGDMACVVKSGSTSSH